LQVKIDNTPSDYHLIKAGVLQGSVIGPLLNLIYTADGPTRGDTLIATFADNTAILSSDADPVRASERLYHHLNLLQNWLKMENQGKPGQIHSNNIHNKKKPLSQVYINNVPIPIKTEVKYLGLHVDQKLTWRTHIKAKRRQLEMKLKNISRLKTN
jgi:hypothetical protein